ncbi:MAG: Na+/H+ antiporter NhaA [Pseudomonadota bacterium]
MPRVAHLFRFEQGSGLIMLLAAGLALVAANSPLAPLYQEIHHSPVHLRLGAFAFKAPLVEWINQGLMVFFFLLVGLEIKRQFIEGHFATVKCALLPAFAALGGMATPALLYWLLNQGDAVALRGWAIPTATDIVLALGVLSLLGQRVPAHLRVFLTTLAIFDDIGAVAIIGVFYGDGFPGPALWAAALAGAALVALNRFAVVAASAYVAAGLALWIAMFEAGLNAALAGVVIALAVPMRTRGFSPLRAATRRLHPWSILVIVPAFAFFNAGVAIDHAAFAGLFSPLGLGIAGGLFLGKQAGIFAMAWLAVRLGIAEKPATLRWRQLYGGAVLAGVGFTMSLFITALAFDNPTMAATARLAILAGSLLSATAGMLVLWLGDRVSGRAGIAR